MWYAKTAELGKVKVVWPKEIEPDKNWGKSIGYYDKNSNKFYLCSREITSKSLQTRYLEFIKDHLKDCNKTGRAFLLGISTGDKSMLDKEDIGVFRRSGLSHLLAVSGYHVGLVGFIPLLLIRSRYRSLRVFALLGLAMIWAFVIACGAPVSAIRSGIMISIVFISFWVDRSALPFNSLAISAWVLAIFDSKALMDIGTWLSYASTAGILSQVYSSKYLIFRIPIAAQTATLPITSHVFQQLPIFFLPLNIIASLIMTLVGILFGLSILYQPIINSAAELISIAINMLHQLDELVPLSFEIQDSNSFIAGSVAGYAWLFSPVLPRNLSRIISATAILVAIFDLWIKFI